MEKNPPLAPPGRGTPAAEDFESVAGGGVWGTVEGKRVFVGRRPSPLAGEGRGEG